MLQPSRLRHRAFVLLSGGSVLLASSGACETPTGRQFRDAALPAIQSGVQSILSGFVDGVFASIAVETTNADDSNNGGTSNP